MNDPCPQCQSEDYGPFSTTDGAEILVCLVCSYDNENGSTTKQCSGSCGRWVRDDLLCCDPCWARIPTRVPGYDSPWRSARAIVRRHRSSNHAWDQFGRATDAARAWLVAHPASVSTSDDGPRRGDQPHPRGRTHRRQ